MTKQEKKVRKYIWKESFVKAFSERLWVNYNKGHAIMSELTLLLTEMLLDWYQVKFYDLWIFKIVQRKERKWRNPSTWEEIILPAQPELKFKQSQTFKDYFLDVYKPENEE